MEGITLEEIHIAVYTRGATSPGSEDGHPMQRITQT
jgi:hypothetical protein